MSIAEFAKYLSQLGIAVVDYPIEELEEELRIHWRQDSEITRMHDP
jgi:hypothetical protein